MADYRITHIAGGGDRGGAKTHILSLLKNLDASLFKVTLICLNEGALVDDARAHGIEVRVFPMYSNLDMTVISRLAGYLREMQPDLIHTHGVRANFCGRTAARLAGRKHILTTIHSLVSMDYATKMSNWFFSLVDRMSVPLTEHLICVSHQLKMHMVRLGIPESKISVIHNGIDDTPFKKITPEDKFRIRAQWGLSPDLHVVGAVGRLVPIKGYDVFLRAAEKVTAHVPESVFMIVGDGPCLDSLKDLARDLGIQDRVIFTGFQENIPEIFGMMDVFVISSFSEGGPIVLLEAMASGVPAIATRVGGVPEVLRNGENGYMVEPRNPEDLADRIIRLLEDKGLAYRFQQEAYHTLENEYTVEKVTEKTEELYLRILQG